MEEREKPLVLVLHDESTFNANDGKRRVWKKKGKKNLYDSKERGKELPTLEVHKWSLVNAS